MYREREICVIVCCYKLNVFVTCDLLAYKSCAMIYYCDVYYEVCVIVCYVCVMSHELCVMWFMSYVYVIDYCGGGSRG